MPSACRIEYAATTKCQEPRPCLVPCSVPPAPVKPGAPQEHQTASSTPHPQPMPCPGPTTSLALGHHSLRLPKSPGSMLRLNPKTPEVDRHPTSRSVWCSATASRRACTSSGLQAPVTLRSPSSSLRHLSLQVSGSLPSWSPILLHLRSARCCRSASEDAAEAVCVAVCAMLRVSRHSTVQQALPQEAWAPAIHAADKQEQRQWKDMLLLGCVSLPSVQAWMSTVATADEV